MPGSSSPAIHQRKKRNPKFPSTRARQQHQMQTLAAQAKELEALLQLLTRSTGRCVLPSGLRELEAEKSAPLALWRSAAVRQREQLQLSKLENQQLRDRLLEQKKLSRSLQRMLSERESKSAIAHGKLLQSACSIDAIHDDHAAFRQMLASLGSMYVGMQQTLRAIESVCPASGSFSQWAPRFGAAGKSVSIEMFACREVPFPKRAVDRAMFLHRHQHKQSHRSFDIQSFGGPPDVDATTEVTRIPHTFAAAAYRQRQMTRSVHSEERSISMTIAYVDSVDESGRPVPGFQFRVELWTVRTQLAHVDPRSGATAHSTVVKWFSTVTPVAVHGVYSLRWAESSVQSAVIPMWDRQISSRLQLIENFLVDRSLATPAVL